MIFLFKGVIFRFHVNFPGCKDATFLWLCFQTNFIQQRIENWASDMNEFIPLQHQNWVTWTAWGSSISQLLNDIYVKGCKVTSPRPAKTPGTWLRNDTRFYVILFTSLLFEGLVAIKKNQGQDQNEHHLGLWNSNDDFRPAMRQGASWSITMSCH